jgi:hypothetical protein
VNRNHAFIEEKEDLFNGRLVKKTVKFQPIKAPVDSQAGPELTMKTETQPSPSLVVRGCGSEGQSLGRLLV